MPAADGSFYFLLSPGGAPGEDTTDKPTAPSLLQHQDTKSIALSARNNLSTYTLNFKGFFLPKMKPSEIPFLMALFWCLCLCQVCFKLCAKFLVGLSPFPASHLFRKEYQVTALANKKQKVWGQNHSSHSESQSSPQLISVLTCFNSSKYHCFISLHAHQASLTFRCSGNSMLSGKEGCELRSACGFSSLRAAQHTQKTTLVRSQPGLHKVYKCYGPRDQDCPRFWGGCSVTSCLTCAWWNIRLSMGMKRRKAGLCP